VISVPMFFAGVPDTVRRPRRIGNSPALVNFLWGLFNASVHEPADMQCAPFTEVTAVAEAGGLL
jgi:hypothetical protein